MIKANPSPNGNGFAFNLSGDPYGTWTHVTAVKGRCLNRLTKGPILFCLRIVVAAVGFEPTTCRVWTGRYNQLSYAAIFLAASANLHCRSRRLVAEVGFEPHDLRVMSPTSYQAAPLRAENAHIYYINFSGLSTKIKPFYKKILFCFSATICVFSPTLRPSF